MRLRWPGRNLRRRRLAWLALAALLFQQLGMAALACELVELSQPPMPMMTAGCEEMASHAPETGEACVRSCSPEASASAEARPGQVPPLALPAAPYALDAALAMPDAGACADIPAQAVGPPPMLLFCSLLI